jgi:hypothetical protein
MGIRETLNEKKGLATAVAAGVVVVALVVIVYQSMGGGVSSSGPTIDPSQSYYSDDDGASFFADDKTKAPPFDHNGKPAVRAHLYSCDGGKTKFVGFLERVNPDVLQRLRQSGTLEAFMNDDVPGKGWERKRPGGKGTWVGRESPDFREMMKVLCPGTSTAAEPVVP